MRSHLDSFAECRDGGAVFSILKLGTRLVGCLEILEDKKRKIIIFSYIKTPFRSLTSGSDLFEISENEEQKCPGHVIYEEKIFDIDQKNIIKEMLHNISELDDYSDIDWSSSYSIPRDSLRRVLDCIKLSKDRPPIYLSVNSKRTNVYHSRDNYSWFIDLLEKSEVNFRIPSDGKDPQLCNSSYFNYRRVFDYGDVAINAYKNSLPAVRQDIRQGKDVNKVLDPGYTGEISIGGGIGNYAKFSALMLAVCHNNYEMVRLLLHHKADINLRVEIGIKKYTAMDFAILLRLDPKFIALFYNLDAKHYLSLDCYNQDNTHDIESLKLSRFRPPNASFKNTKRTSNHAIEKTPSYDEKKVIVRQEADNQPQSTPEADLLNLLSVEETVVTKKELASNRMFMNEDQMSLNQTGDKRPRELIPQETATNLVTINSDAGKLQIDNGTGPPPYFERDGTEITTKENLQQSEKRIIIQQKTDNQSRSSSEVGLSDFVSIEAFTNEDQIGVNQTDDKRSEETGSRETATNLVMGNTIYGDTDKMQLDKGEKSHNTEEGFCSHTPLSPNHNSLYDNVSLSMQTSPRNYSEMITEERQLELLPKSSN